MIENCILVSDWLSQNQLCLNADKTHLVVTGTSNRLSMLEISTSIDISMDGFNLEESEDMVPRFSDLKWSKHVDELKSKLRTILAGLSKVSLVCFRKQIAEGIFTSVLVYCIPLWGCVEKGDTEDL